MLLWSETTNQNWIKNLDVVVCLVKKCPYGCGAKLQPSVETGLAVSAALLQQLQGRQPWTSKKVISLYVLVSFGIYLCQLFYIYLIWHIAFADTWTWICQYIRCFVCSVFSQNTVNIVFFVRRATHAVNINMLGCVACNIAQIALKNDWSNELFHDSAEGSHTLCKL